MYFKQKECYLAENVWKDIYFGHFVHVLIMMKILADQMTELELRF